MPDTKVDVVVPTYNNLAELEDCLRHLGRQSLREFRAIVCIDGSTDDTGAYLAGSGWPYELLVLEHADGGNHGRAAVRNLAIGHLRAPFTCFLDSDMRLEREALEQHVKLVTDRRCASVGRISYRNAATSRWARYLATRGSNRYPDGAPLPFNQFVTANVVLHTADVHDLGGFDDSLQLYGGEDSEFGYRLLRRGVPIILNGSARAWTVEEKTLENALERYRMLGHTNLHILYERHPDMPRMMGTGLLSSRGIRARLTVAALDARVARVVRPLASVLPFSLAQHVIRYEIAAAVVGAYRSSVAPPKPVGASPP